MKSIVTLAAASICAAVVVPCAPANAATAAARNYDCSKAGNASKAVCKGAVPASPAKPKPANVAAAKPAAAVAAKPAAAPRTMTYDCTKLGNRTKAACKGATAAAPSPVINTAVPRPLPRVAAAPLPAPKMPPRVIAATPSSGGRIVAWTEKNGKVVHYDCSKAGNATKQACK